jgi:hypothetical protein
MKQTNKQRKLVLETETIKVLDQHRLGQAAGGSGRTFTCVPSTTNSPTHSCLHTC